MSTSPISMPVTSSSVLNTPASATSSSSSSSTASEQNAVDALGNPDTFLKLLVAQLQYQDPQSPADGTTFVTQLATFAGVEEQSAMRGDLDSINGVAQQWSASQSAAPAATASVAATDPSSSTGTAANSENTPSAGTAPATSGGSTGTSN